MKVKHITFPLVILLMGSLLSACCHPHHAGRPTDSGESQKIALEHAGYSADQVSLLRAEFDYDDGIVEYGVSFRVDRWEYEYEIHAESGQILSWERDD